MKDTKFLLTRHTSFLQYEYSKLYLRENKYQIRHCNTFTKCNFVSNIVFDESFVSNKEEELFYTTTTTNNIVQKSVCMLSNITEK